MSNTLLVMTTLPDQASAEQLAEQLLSQKLAACVNILPAMASLYMWKEKLEHGKEHLLLIKTLRECYGRLESEIRKNHPYELPEIIGLPVISGLTAYFDWIAANATAATNDNQQ